MLSHKVSMVSHKVVLSHKVTLSFFFFLFFISVVYSLRAFCGLIASSALTNYAYSP